MENVDKEDKKHHSVVILVNEQPVTITQKEATAVEIKTAAKAQGVHIEINFLLIEELPNGTSKNIGDNDPPIHIREHLKFTAIAPDDNS